uniref:[histone H3]-lysine(27) N-trimethyltransferase n=1 Tax=Panagrolaimus davidi TaxID=227884 RepID=A0A914Q002_9BILA
MNSDNPPNNGNAPRRSDRPKKPNLTKFATSCPAQSSRQSKRSEPIANVTEAAAENHPEIDPYKEELIKEIQAEYLQAKQVYDSDVSTDGYDYFNHALDNHVLDIEPPLEVPFVPVPEITPVKPNSENSIAKFSGGKKVTKLNVFLSERASALPKMIHWINTNINIAGKDQLFLNNFPYLGDGDYDDAKIVKELPKLFPEGIHGNVRGWGKPINNWLLFHTCNPIMKRHEWQSHEELERLMKIMHELFPQKGSTEELLNCYPDLIQKYDPENATFPPGLYDKNGRIAGHFPPEVIHHSNTTLICRRCYTFDCVYHPLTENDAHVERRDDGRMPEIEESCGVFCYKVATDDGEVEWSNEEKSYIDLLSNANIDNSCRMAQFLVNMDCSKTCKQVYDYLRAKEPLAPILLDPNRIVGNDRKLPRISSEARKAFQRSCNGKLVNSRPYQSCKHLGTCSVKNGCGCKADGIVCTKFCACPSTCTSKFPGCNCKPGTCDTHHCECFLASWECDPDLCQSCNCDGGDGQDGRQLCKNTNLQRGFSRKLFAARSQVSGNGCFTAEDIRKGEFVGEYCGEIISHDEGERRGKIYDANKCSYLFNLNSAQTLDAGRYGSIVRFVNHSDYPNVRPKILVVSGEQRVGFFALRNIKSGEELFFDYEYNSSKKKEFNFVEKKESRET